MSSSPLIAIKENFFDTRKIERAIETGMRNPLSRFGAFVRRRARSSIRKRKSVSAPGKPPTSWSGLLRKFIYFSYDPQAKSVVIGPVPFRATSAVPRLLEMGGSVAGDGREISITNDVGRDAAGKLGGKSRIKLEGTINYRARPFMRPAFSEELPGFLQSLKDMVK